MKITQSGFFAKATAAAAIVGLGVVLAGCSSSSPLVSKDSVAVEPAAGVNTSAPLYDSLPAEIRQKGSITVGADASFPPYEFFAKDGKTIIGVTRAWMDAVEKQLGVPIVYENVAFDSIIPGLAADRYDMSVSLGDLKVREEVVDFLDLFYGGGAIMTTADNPHDIASMGDLCGLKIAIQKGTSVSTEATAQSEKCTAADEAPLELSDYPSMNNVLLALQTGRADAAMVDYSSTSYLVKTEGANMTTLPPYQKVKLGAAFPKGSALVEVIQRAMEQVKSDGVYLDVLAKYGQEDAAIEEFTINGALS